MQKLGARGVVGGPDQPRPTHPPVHTRKIFLGGNEIYPKGPKIRGRLLAHPFFFGLCQSQGGKPWPDWKQGQAGGACAQPASVPPTTPDMSPCARRGHCVRCGQTGQLPFVCIQQRCSQWAGLREGLEGGREGGGLKGGREGFGWDPPPPGVSQYFHTFMSCEIMKKIFFAFCAVARQTFQHRAGN